MSEYTFEQILQSLGHLYVERAVSSPVEKVRHLVKAENEELIPYCAEPARPLDTQTESCIALRELHYDLNCQKCRDLIGLPPASLTKRSLMVDLVHILVNIEMQFIEAIYWNMHRLEEDPINPDDDGTLAETWEKSADQLIRMIEMARVPMVNHGAKYGWPELLKEQKDGK